MPLRKRLIALLYVFTGIIVVWALGFIAFLCYSPNDTCTNADVDAIVVLTGGKNRVEEAMALYHLTSANEILISGAGRGVNVKSFSTILKKHDIPKQKLVIGNIAKDTFGNAEETKIFAESRGYKSLCIVTSKSHMLRSLKLIKTAIPSVHIKTHTVQAADTNICCATKWFLRVWSEFLEYNKLIAVYFICFSNLISEEYEKMLYKYL